ncbi:MAG: hypothetical protein PHY05_04675 [Methanothrix sp.]|nr:hypothetical protein [Methanothrix sp.]MDD4446724.1 hypothetical protein [Methanothrix sp.]
MFEVIMLATAMAQGSRGTTHYPTCNLLLNISAEEINHTNENDNLYFNKNEPVTLKFELINNLEEDYYNWMQLKYNISDLYKFPLNSIRVTSENTPASDGTFSISFYRTKINKDDYLEVNKKGVLDFYCKNFQPIEKIYFNFSTKISDKPKMTGEFEIAELRADNIVFDSNRIRRDDTEDNIKIKRLNKIIVNSANHNNTSLNGKNNIIYRTDLFSWDKIPGEDETRLIEVLTQRFSIDLSKGANIEKIDNNKTIKVFNENENVTLELNDKKNRVIMKIDGVRKNEFIAKIENSELKIYLRTNGYLILIVKIAIIVFLLMVYYITVEFKLQNFKKSNYKYKYMYRAIFIFVIICSVVCFVTNNYLNHLINILLGISGSIMATVILKYFDDREQSNE